MASSSVGLTSANWTNIGTAPLNVFCGQYTNARELIVLMQAADPGVGVKTGVPLALNAPNNVNIGGVVWARLTPADPVASAATGTAIVTA